MTAPGVSRCSVSSIAIPNSSSMLAKNSSSAQLIPRAFSSGADYMIRHGRLAAGIDGVRSGARRSASVRLRLGLEYTRPMRAGVYASDDCAPWRASYACHAVGESRCRIFPKTTMDSSRKPGEPTTSSTAPRMPSKRQRTTTGASGQRADTQHRRGKAPAGAPHGSRPDQVYARLRELIVQGMLAPGSRIVETEIATRLGVSRTPVREALQRLLQEGYVIDTLGTQQSRLTVAPLTREDVHELLNVVGALEGIAARPAAELPED